MKTGRIASFVTLTLPLLAATPALAQGTDAQRAACSGDAFRLCASSMPNADKVAVCLHRAKEQLSPACRSVFEAADSGGQGDGSVAKAAPPPAKDTVTAAPPAATASDPAPKESATAAPPAETAQTPAPADTAKVTPPTSVAAAPNPNVVRATPRPASAASRTVARSTPRPAVASRPTTAKGATSKAAARQLSRSPSSARFVSKRQRGPRSDSDLAQARYWMKRITGVSIGSLAGLLPN